MTPGLSPYYYTALAGVDRVKHEEIRIQSAGFGTLHRFMERANPQGLPVLEMVIECDQITDVRFPREDLCQPDLSFKGINKFRRNLE